MKTLHVIFRRDFVSNNGRTSRIFRRLHDFLLDFIVYIRIAIITVNFTNY